MLEKLADWPAETWQVMLELAPWLMFGLFMAGLLHVLLPIGYIRKHLGGHGVTNVLKAVAVGIPMPLCSCGVIPTGIGLKRDGASDGACVGFLIATPQTGMDSFFVAASLLGWPFALFKIAAALITGMFGGLITNHVGHRHPAPPDSAGEMGMRSGGLKDRAKALFGFGFGEILGSVAGWMLLGVLIAGLITVLVPENYFADVPWMQGLGGMLVMLVIALPMYVCAVASVPIAAGLVVHAGMPAGAALVFLMAGPASNIATIGAIFKAFGGRVVAVYLATVAVFSVLLGWLFQSVIGGEAARAAGQTGHLVPHWLAFTCAIIITVLMAWHVYRSLRMRYRVGPAETSDAPKLRFDVQGMTCGNCVAHVENAVEGVEGVQAVSVDLEESRALVAGSPDPSAVEAAIREAGYEASYLGEEQPVQCEYAVEGMTCKNCAMHVEKAVRDVKGVDSCVVDLGGKRARVQGEDFDRDAVAHAIEEAGYEARPTQ